MVYAPKKIPQGLYVYVIVLFLITLFLRVLLTSYYNSSYSGIEQNVIYGIQRILSGQQLYQDPSAGTYAIMQYTPLYYYFTATLAKCIGVHAPDVQGIYTLCRVLAIIFNLLTVLTVALIIRSFRFSWVASLVFAMPVLMILTAHYYTRGDSMHLFLFVSAIYSYVRFSKTGGLQNILVAALFSGGCIMTKQSGVLVAGLIGCCLVFTEKKYLGALFYCLCTFCFAYLIAIVCIHNDWLTFYQNAYLGLKNGVDLSFLYLIFTSQYFLDMVPCYFLGGIVTWLAIRKINDSLFRIIATGAALSFLFALTSGLKIGSSNNYFTEFLIFVILAVPCLLQDESGNIKLFRHFGRTVTIRFFTGIVFLILISSKTIGLFTSVYIEKSVKNDEAEYAKEKQLYQYVINTLQIKQGEYIFFTDRLYLDNIFMEYAIMPNKDVIAQVYAANHTTYDYAPFIAGMNSGLVKYIITTEKKPDINEWNKTIPFILFDENKFRLLANYLGYSVYVYSPL